MMDIISGGRNALLAPVLPGVSGVLGFCEGCSGVGMLPPSSVPSGLDPTMRFMASGEATSSADELGGRRER